MASAPIIPSHINEADCDGSSWRPQSWKSLIIAGVSVLVPTVTTAGLLLAKGHRRPAGIILGGVTLTSSLVFSAARVIMNHFLRSYRNDEEDPEESNAFAELCSRALTAEEAETIDRNRERTTKIVSAWREDIVDRVEYIQSDDGAKLCGHRWELDPRSKKWVILVHGWNGAWDSMCTYGYGYEYAQQGYNLLMPVLRGHGDSDGDFVGMGWLDRRDLVAWATWLVRRYGSDVEIVAHGHSMGAASVLLMAAEPDLPTQVHAVIADSGYSDATNLFAPIVRTGFHLPAHPTVELGRLAFALQPEGYDFGCAAPEDAAPKTRVPILVIHGIRDTLVPPYMARRIYDALPEDKRELLEIPAGHCQSLFANPKQYWDRVRSFISRA